MIYLNFLMIKQIIQAMFNDMVFNRAEKAASMFTIDLSRKRGESITGATQSTWMSVLLVFVYYACDAVVIALLTWLFGASAFVNKWDCIQLGCFAAVIMRESVTICRMPEIPKLEHALKKVDPGAARSMGDKSTDQSDEVVNNKSSNLRRRRVNTDKPQRDEKADDDSSSDQPMLKEGNAMPGKLQQGPCLLNFYPFDAWSSRKWRLAKINYHRERLSKIYRVISER